MQRLRDSTGACIFCGVIAFAAEEPCECEKYKKAIAQKKAAEESRSRLEELCAPNAQGWRDEIDAEEFSELVLLLEIVARELLPDISAKLKNGTKVHLKNNGGGVIAIERKEGAKTVKLNSGGC